MTGLISLLTALLKFFPWLGDFVTRLKARQNEKQALERRDAKHSAADDRIDSIVLGSAPEPRGKADEPGRLPGSGPGRT